MVQVLEVPMAVNLTEGEVEATCWLSGRRMMGSRVECFAPHAQFDHHETNCSFSGINDSMLLYISLSRKERREKGIYSLANQIYLYLSYYGKGEQFSAILVNQNKYIVFNPIYSLS